MEALTYPEFLGPHSLQPINQTGLTVVLADPRGNVDVYATPAGILARLASPSHRGNVVLVEVLAVLTPGCLLSSLPLPGLLVGCSALSQAPHRFGLLGAVCGIWGLFLSCLVLGKDFLH